MPVAVIDGVPCPSRDLCVSLDPVDLLPLLGEITPGFLVAGQGAIQLGWQTHDLAAGRCPTGPAEKAAAIRITLPSEGGQLTVDGPFGDPPPQGIAPCDGWIGIFAFGPTSPP